MDFKNKISSYMTDQKGGELEKLAAVGTHRAFALQIPLKLLRKKELSRVAKFRLKTLPSHPNSLLQRVLSQQLLLLEKQA